MTCVAGLVDGDSVWMGGDSASVAGSDLMVRADPKVFRNGPFLMGFTTSFRMGQLLRYRLVPPARDPDVDLDRFMVTDFTAAVRGCLKDGGYAKKENEQESAGTFLVGYRGELFLIDVDYQVGRPADPFAAVGCGSQAALGSLFSTAGRPPRERVLLALSAAERLSTGVRGPFTVESLP